MVRKSDEVAIEAVTRRLARRYSAIPPEWVSLEVREVLAGFDDSAVRDFVPLLVERRAGEELARLTE